MERLEGEGENMELTGQDSSVVLGREQDRGRGWRRIWGQGSILGQPAERL